MGKRRPLRGEKADMQSPADNTGCDCGRGNIRLRHLTGAWGPRQDNEVTGWLSFVQKAGPCLPSTQNSPEFWPI